jgi:hypothetical protein
MGGTRFGLIVKRRVLVYPYANDHVRSHGTCDDCEISGAVGSNGFGRIPRPECASNERLYFHP